MPSVLATAALILSTLVAPTAPIPVTDPVPTEPITSSLGLVLQEYASFPQSQPTPAPIDSRLMRIARINTIMEVPDRSGRRAVPDLNGALYFVEDGKPHVYLDVKAQF